jgi:hypothetical protein
MLDGYYPVARSAWDLFSFVDGKAELEPLVGAGTLPWWSHPELRLRGLRPLASALIALDHRLLGLSPFAQHLHSFGWFALLVAGHALLARRLLPLGPAALAVALFAIDPTHVMPIGWLANRTALVSAALGVLALWAHLRRREDGWRPGAPLATLLFALSLAAGEYALAMLAYLVAYEVVAGPGRARERALATLTGLVPALLYMAARVWLGYGASGSTSYVDPLESPGKFALAAVLRVPALLASELSLSPPDPVIAGTVAAGPIGLAVLLVMLGLVLALVPGALARTAPQTKRKAGAFALGALFSLMPLAATSPSARLLLVPSIGGSIAIAALLLDGARAVTSPERRRKARSWLRASITLPLALLHLGGSPIATWYGASGWRDLHLRRRETYLSAPIDDRRVAEQTLVLVNATDPLALISVPYVRATNGSPMPKHWRALSITRRGQRLARPADDTLEVSIKGVGLLEDPVAQLFRSIESPLAPGDVVTLPDVRVEVVEVGGWGPTRVRYRFTKSLDDPLLVVLVSHKGALRRLPPLRVGAPSVPIPES